MVEMTASVKPGGRGEPAETGKRGRERAGKNPVSWRRATCPPGAVPCRGLPTPVLGTPPQQLLREPPGAPQPELRSPEAVWELPQLRPRGSH